MFMFGCSDELELFAGRIILEDETTIKSKIDSKPIFNKRPRIVTDYLNYLVRRHRDFFELGLKAN